MPSVFLQEISIKKMIEDIFGIEPYRVGDRPGKKIDFNRQALRSKNIIRKAFHNKTRGKGKL